MAVRITDANQTAVLNQFLGELQALQRRVDQLHKQVQNTAQDTKQADNTKQVSAANNIVYSWNGPGSHVSWPESYVKTKQGNNFPVPAGQSPTLTPNSYYWAVFNTFHKTMGFTQDVNELLHNDNNIIVCQFFTGTLGQSGVAGGGGSEALSGLSHQRYKFF